MKFFDSGGYIIPISEVQIVEKPRRNSDGEWEFKIHIKNLNDKLVRVFNKDYDMLYSSYQSLLKEMKNA